MLTFLNIGNVTYDAVQLLTLMQQVWPDREQPEGDGGSQNGWKTPWKLRTAPQWFWAAKRIASFTRHTKFEVPGTSSDSLDKQFWFDIAGRLIAIQAESLYARDYGDVVPDPRRAPSKVTSMEISYTGIYEKMLEEYGTTFNDANAAADFRGVLQGAKPGNGSVSMRLLAAVLFLSEAGRNHTAFHTGLMLLDLIEAGVQIGDASSFKYNFKGALWSPETVDAILANKVKPKEEKVPVPKVAEESNAMAIAAHGGETALGARMGLATMSHALSESGGAFDLTGKGVFQAPDIKQKGGLPVKGVRWENPSSSLTYVRRKEATLLIRWLSKTIKKKNAGLQVTVGDGATVFDTANAYDFVPQFFADTHASAPAMEYIVPLIKDRTKTFEKMI